MMKTGTEFTYDSYHSILNINVFDIPIEKLLFVNRDFKRCIRIFKENGIYIDLATAYISRSLGLCCGLSKSSTDLLAFRQLFQ